MKNSDMDSVILSALHEDIGEGDHSTLACISPENTGEARMIAKDSGIICGIPVGKRVFELVNPDLVVTTFKTDGDTVAKGDLILTVKGSSASILTAERTALNFMQRMSGIATQTHVLTEMLSGMHTKLLDTRTTTPNLRRFEKYAVKTGGGENHRFGLYDMIMLKDNHIDFAGGIKEAIVKTNEYLKAKGMDLKIEIEVRNIDELRQVLAVGNVHRIMLDNFTPELLKEAVSIIGGRYETEASGGITEKTLLQYAESGVDFISMGALTHHIKSLDISLVV